MRTAAYWRYGDTDGPGVGPVALALLVDSIGILGVPRIPLSVSRLAGVAVLAVGALLIARK